MKLYLFLFTFILSIASIHAQDIGTTYNPEPSQNTYFDVSDAIGAKDPIPPQGALSHHLWKNGEVGNLFKEKHFNNKENALPLDEDPVWQKENGQKGITPPLISFEGVRNSDNASGVAPPDTDGDVGPNHYFQMCNVAFEIFDKTGVSLMGPADNSTIWSGFVGDWTGTNDGDPIVVYDEHADRWLVTQFAVDTDITGGTYWILCAISTTSNPLGAYYRYAFEYTDFPDYPKFGVWQDGYYLMVQHGTAAGDATFTVLNRTQMIAGDATIDRVDFAVPGLPGGGFVGLLPADNDGPWAPAGSPNYFMYFSDDAWGDDPVDRLKIWEFDVDWSNTASSSLTLTQNLDTEPFDSDFGSFFVGAIDQPGTGQDLSALNGALMQRLNYRNFGTHESMVCAHTVDVDGTDHAGVRWYELRKTTGDWSIYQEGTYCPDEDNYWMPSAAINADGDIAIGYSVSGASTYPSIRYTGRNPGDPLGELSLTEQTIIDGANSQTDTRRWGDYACMSVDPDDDRTFWFTSEYIGSGTNFAPWITQIASFNLEDYCITTTTNPELEHISNVTVGTINNSSGADGYMDYTNLSTDIPLNSSEPITVTNGSPYDLNQCGIWVDWNKDGDFEDADETIVVSGSPGTGPYTAVIDPPASATLGECIMRIRIVYNITPSPCGNSTYGEVEDYSLNVASPLPNTWVGTFNSYWHNANNWSLGYIPVSGEDVIIANAGNQPVYVDDYPGVTNEVCKNLLVETGATLTFYDMTLIVEGNLTVDGEIQMTQEDGTLDVLGNAAWNTGSEFSATHNLTFVNVYGDWSFNSGANFSPTMGFVDFRGSSDAWIRCYSDISHFYNMRIYKTGGAKAKLSNLCTSDLVVDNLLFITTGGIFESLSISDIVLNGNFNFYGTFDFTQNANTGSVIFDGNTQTFNNYSSGSGLFNNVVFSSTIGTTGLTNLDVANDITIEEGSFSPEATIVTLGGDWTNTVGPDGFVEEDSRVIFNGPGHQYVYSDETFNILEADMGAALRPIGNTVICEVYDWTSGGIDVLNGTFTANDLFDNGIFGGFWVNPGGVINLNNPGGYVDLSGYLYNFGGTINIAGTISYWPYQADAGVTMSDGVINLSDCGIVINNTPTYTLTTDITGGTIRTAYGFQGDRADFQPTAGTFEFYGSTDATLSQSNGCTLFDVVIDKEATKEKSQSFTTFAVSDRKDPTKKVSGSKADKISLSSSFVATNNFNITSGTFALAGNQLTVSGNCFVYGSLIMDNPADALVVGIDYFDMLAFYSGSTGTLSDGIVDIYGWIIPYAGCSFTASTNNTVYVKGTYGGGISNFEPTAVFGNIDVFKTAGERCFIDGAATETIVVNGDFTMHPDNIIETQNSSLVINGFLYDDPSSEIYGYDAPSETGFAASSAGVSKEPQLVYEKSGLENSPDSIAGPKGGSIELFNDFTLYGILELGDGDVLHHGKFDIDATGVLSIDGGSYVCDYSLASGFSYLSGEFNMTTGLLEFTGASLTINGTSNISGGTVRVGKTIRAISAGGFVPSDGTLELIGGTFGNYIEFNNGNYVHDFLFNKTSSYLIYPASTNDLVVEGNVEINSGTLNTNGNDIYVGGNWMNSAGSSAFTEGSETVIFAGSTEADILSDETFYNMVVDKSASSYEALELASYMILNILNDLQTTDGTLELNSNTSLIVGNSVTLSSGSGLNAFGDAGINIEVGGDWLNNNTSYNTIVGYTPGEETITFNGLSDQTITTSAVKEDFGSLIISKPGGAFRPNNSLNIKGDLLIDDGQWNDNVSNLVHYFEGDFEVGPFGSYFSTISHNTAVFMGVSDQSIAYNSTSGYFCNVTIDKSDWPTDNKGKIKGGEKPVNNEPVAFLKGTKDLNVTLTTDIDMQFGNELKIDEGSLNLNGFEYTTMGDININDGGSLIIPANSILRVDDEDALNVNSGGSLEISGYEGNESQIRVRSSGTYDFEINSGGLVSASHCLIRHTGTNGVWVKMGATVDPANAFNYCSFSDGTAGFAPLLVFNNDQVLMCEGVNFPQTGVSDINVAKSNNEGEVTMFDATGDFSGPDYEYDLNNRIHWEYSPPISITSPSTNTMWTPGEYYEILWESTLSPTEDLRIQLYEGGAFHSTLAFSTINDGKFIWTLPGTLSDDCNYQIRIYQNSDPGIEDYSVSFCVGTPIVTFTNPKYEGITWAQEEYNPVKWTSTLAPAEQIRLQLWKGDEISPYSTLAFTTDNDGIFNWVTPASIEDGCGYYFKIYRLSDPDQFGVSPRICFGPPTIFVTTPSQGVNWYEGNYWFITWSSSLPPEDDVNIQLYKDGSYVQHLAFVTGNDGSFIWTIPEGVLFSDCDYTIRIGSNTTDDFGISKEFCIGPPPADYVFIEGNVDVKTNVMENHSEKDLSLSLHPNPVTEILNMDISNLAGDNLEIFIYDAYGKKIWEKSCQEFDYRHTEQYNVQILGEGMYMVVILNEGRMTQKKFLKY